MAMKKLLFILLFVPLALFGQLNQSVSDTIFYYDCRHSLILGETDFENFEILYKDNMVWLLQWKICPEFMSGGVLTSILMG